VLDVGPAHGFFAFELERRGASRVVTLELPTWSAHDGSGELHESFAAGGADAAQESYLHGALDFAVRARGSRVEQRYGNVYDLDPDVHGTFDVVFCGSMLLHITDPLRALYAIRSVTAGVAILATMIDPGPRRARLRGVDRPLAAFHGSPTSQVFWVPNRACFEAWALAAGFRSAQWVDQFNVTSLDGEFDTPHGVIHARP
jgi:tRNA (mo5U34)-methyltransferase